jgi:putative oxidoreductase
MTPIAWIRYGYELLTRWAGPVVWSVVLLLLRVVWGLQFFLAGKGKLGNINRPIAFFHDLGIPFPTANAWLVACVECFGGLLLLVGLASRPVALALTINMTVAYLTADREAVAALFKEGDVPTFAAAAPFWFLVASAVVLACGPGRFSADALLGRLLSKRRCATTTP